MIRSRIRAARPLRGRANSGLSNPIETRKALLICVANHRFTTLTALGVFFGYAAGMLKRALPGIAILVTGVLSAGCPSKETLAFAIVADGVINDPANKSLRF